MRLRRFPRGAFSAAEPPELRELRLLRGVELPPSSLLSSSLLLPSSRGESRSASSLRRRVSPLADVTEGESLTFLGILTCSAFPSGPPGLFPATQIRLPPAAGRGEASSSLSLLSLPLLSLPLSLSLLSMILRWRRRGPRALPVSSQHAVFPIAAPRVSPSCAQPELRSA